MTAVLPGISKRVLANPLVQVDVKVMAIKMHILSTGLHNAATWPRLHLNEMQLIHSAVSRVYRRTIVDALYTAGERVSDLDLYFFLPLQRTGAMICQQRLCLLVTVVRIGADRLSALLAAARRAPRSWVRAVEHDLVLLAVVLPVVLPLLQVLE